MKRKHKLLTGALAVSLLSIFVIHTQALSINKETYQTVEMVGKYQIAFATSSNVFGCQDNIHGYQPTNTPVRLPGDNGGRISITNDIGQVYGGGGNSSASLLSKPTSNARIAKAYLVQEAFFESGKEYVLTNYPMTLKGPAGGSTRATASTIYTSSNDIGVTVSDVTDFVKSQGFGAYQGWDIPYLPKTSAWTDQTGAWKLIVICEDETLPVRMVRLKLGSRSTTHTNIGVTIDGEGIKTKSSGNVTGQIIIGGSGGDTDWHGSHFDLQPSPSSGIVRLNTGKNGEMNKADNFFEAIVTHNGNRRTDAAVVGYRNSDNLPVNNDDMILMDTNSTQSNALNGHNAYFVNNSSSISLNAVTENTAGNLSVFGMVADIDTATYITSMSHSSGTLKVGEQFAISATAVNNTVTNKTNLGISGGYAEFTLDNDLSVVNNAISAKFTRADGTQVSIPNAGITVSGNKVRVNYGVDGKSRVGDKLEISLGVKANKEKNNYSNKLEIKANGLIDESGKSNAMPNVFTVANASDGFNVINPPIITASDKEYWDSSYTHDDWENTLRMQGVTASDAEDGNLTDKISVTYDNVQINTAGTYKVTYAVTDSNQTTTTKDIVVKIKYNNPPVITANDLEFYENEKTMDEWKALRDEIATASDIEDGDITDRIELVEDNVNPAVPDTYQVVYKVNDAYGKSHTKTVNVTVKFNNFPELTVVKKSYYENEMHREEWEKTLRMQDITADDVEDGDITSKIKVMADNIDFEKAGKYQVKYRVTDRWGKSGEAEAEVEIKYNNPPVITAEDKVFTEGEYTNKDWKDTLLMQDITAEDIEDGDVTKLITVKSDTVDATVPGWYQVVYTVTDQWGKTTDKAISVNVKYNAVPVIHAENKAFHENEYGADWMDKVLNDVTAEDVEDGNVTDKIEIIKNNVDPKTPGSYEVTFKVVDSLGKSTTKTIDITVLENVKPVLQIFAEDKRFVEGQYTLEEWINELRKEDVAAHDHEDHDLTDKVVIIKDETDPAKPGRYEVTYKVTDRWGKTAEKTVHVTVEPNAAPVIYANDKWFTIGENIDEAALLKNVTAIDDHDGDVSKNVTIQSSNVKANVIGEYKVVYTVADQYGKSATKEVVVHVEGPGGNVVPPQPPIVTDPEAIQLWNGKQMGNVILKKVMEDSIFEQNGWQDVTFGVFTAEDIVYKGKVVLAKDSMVDIVKPDKHGIATATIYTAGKYYVKELSTNGSYNLDPNIYTFTFTYE